LLRDDQRIAGVVELLEAKDELSDAEFRTMLSNNRLIERAFADTLAVRNWKGYCDIISEVMVESAENNSGAVADYIPQLARVEPEQWGVGVCSVDGQRFSSGDCNVPFCVQSCSKPITYAIALEHLGEEKVHRHVGREPSGRNFNERVLNQENLPHNPLINSGAIMTASLARPDLDLPDRWDHIIDTWQRAAGGRRPGFANSVYLSESATADRNWCLAYMMQEAGSFPAGTNLKETLEFYFMNCSLELDAEGMSIVAATLANGGICPLTGDRVFSAMTVRHTLSLMASCGMYDYSGEFAFLMGFPSKSGVGGSLMVVIPGVAGFCTWSPRLDKHGNSSRGIEFCRRLAARFSYHMLDAAQYLGTAFRSEQSGLNAPEHKADSTLVGANNTGLVEIWNAAAAGDLLRVTQLIGRGVPVNQGDYDGRTAAHLAASNGRVEVLRYVLSRGGCLTAEDRYGNTPLADAQREGHSDCVNLIEELQSIVPADEVPVLGDDHQFQNTLAESSLHQQLQLAFKALPTLPVPKLQQYQKRELMTVLENVGWNTGTAPCFATLVRDLPAEFTIDELVDCCGVETADLVLRALTGQLTVPDWPHFAQLIKETFDAAIMDNEVTTPTAASQSEMPSNTAVAVVSVSGQRCTVGDATVSTVLDETAAVLNYCLAQDKQGVDKVHMHIGREPSGRGTAAVVLNADRKPHNPLGAAGSLLLCALGESEQPLHKRFESIRRKYEEAAGGSTVGYDMTSFAKERADADSNYALAYLMRQAGCLPQAASVADMLELFFMCNSVTMTIEGLATVAATLANGGLCPLTSKRVFSESAARNCLSLMASCGHGDASGEFAFRIGLPSKSGTVKNGATMVVVPGIAGFCVWDGRAENRSCNPDAEGSCCPRPVSLAWAFCSKLVKTFRFHCFDHGGSVSDIHAVQRLENPLRHAAAEDELWCAALLNAAAAGDISEYRRLQLLRPSNTAICAKDYDERTALHLAASEGRHRLVRLLLADGADPSAKDRWGGTPLDDAERGGHESVKLELLAVQIGGAREYNQTSHSSFIKTLDYKQLPSVDEESSIETAIAGASPCVGG